MTHTHTFQMNISNENHKNVENNKNYNMLVSDFCFRLTLSGLTRAGRAAKEKAGYISMYGRIWDSRYLLILVLILNRFKSKYLLIRQSCFDKLDF